MNKDAIAQTAWIRAACRFPPRILYLIVKQMCPWCPQCRCTRQYQNAKLKSLWPHNKQTVCFSNFLKFHHLNLHFSAIPWTWEKGHLLISEQNFFLMIKRVHLSILAVECLWCGLPLLS